MAVNVNSWGGGGGRRLLAHYGAAFFYLAFFFLPSHSTVLVLRDEHICSCIKQIKEFNLGLLALKSQ